MKGLSDHSGSIHGGQRMTVTGEDFDDTDGPARVYIDGVECPLMEPITDTTIVCETPAKPASTPVHAGEPSCVKHPSHHADIGSFTPMHLIYFMVGL